MGDYLDDVRIFNRVLSATEISQIYAARTSDTGSPEGALVYNADYCAPQYCSNGIWTPIGNPHAKGGGC